MRKKYNSKAGANVPQNNNQPASTGNNAGAPPPANNQPAANNKPATIGNNASAPPPVNNQSLNNKAPNNKPNNKGNSMNVVSNSDVGKNVGEKVGNMIDTAANTVKNSMNNIKGKINNIPSVGNIADKGKEAVGSIEVSSVNKYLMILLIGVIFILIIMFARYLILNLYNSTDTEPYLIKGTKSGQHTVVIHQNPESINYIPILRSENQEGMEFTYSFWIMINDLDHNRGKWKHIFHKGNSSSYPNRAPGVWLHPNTNKMRVYMNTFDCPLSQYFDVDNIPIKKWICIQIVLQNIHSHTVYEDKTELTNLIEGKKDHIIDFYINGQLKKSKTIEGIPKQNNGDLWINLFGGFNGYISKLKYYARATKYNEIQNIVKEGPASIVTADTGELPPYLDDKWWQN